jgi:putative oxidoreductase
VAWAALRANRHGLRVHAERLGQAALPPEGHGELRGWGIPFPEILTPFVAGVEFVGGIFLLLGLLTRISAGALGVVMIVALRVARWEEVDSVGTLFGFDETLYLAIFLWLAIAGAGAVSLDHLLRRSVGRRSEGFR